LVFLVWEAAEKQRLIMSLSDLDDDSSNGSSGDSEAARFQRLSGSIAQLRTTGVYHLQRTESCATRLQAQQRL